MPKKDTEVPTDFAAGDTEEGATNGATAAAAKPAKPAKTEPAEPTAAQLKREEKERLAKLGLRRCAAHPKLLDQLPEEAKVPVEGQTDAAIRPEDQFYRQNPACIYCRRIRNAEYRKGQPAGQHQSHGTRPQKTPLVNLKIAKKIVPGTTPIGVTAEPNLYPFIGSLAWMARDVQAMVSSGEQPTTDAALDAAMNDIVTLVVPLLRAELAQRLAQGPQAVVAAEEAIAD